MQTKKTYEFVAKVIRKRISSSRNNKAKDIEDTIALLAEDFSYAFQDDNPRFDHERFLKACGLDV